MSQSSLTPNASEAPAKPVDAAGVDDIEIKTDTRPIIRLGFWVLVVGFGLFMAWAAWAPLDEGVPAPATVSVEMRRKPIQHLQGGVIREVRVKEGMEVKEGDVLVALDDAATRASFELIRQNYLGQRAQEGRLLAELSGASTVTFHPDLLVKGDAVAAQHVLVQQQLFASRRAAQNAELAAAQQAIQGVEGQISGMKQMIGSRKEQMAFQQRQLVNVKLLADDGFAPRNQALQLEQANADLRTTLSDLETTVQRLHSAIAEQRLRIAQRQQEILKEVSAQLADVRREVQGNQERLAAITADLGRMQIKAPVSGQVIALAINGAGGVVTPGQKLMEILPRGETLVLEAKVPPQVIDRIKMGDTAEVRFQAFANSPQLVVHGRLLSLSGDAVTEAYGAAVHSYYLARVELTPEGLKALGNRTMQPGMPAEVLIKTGERSLLTYLLHPLVKRVASAMTEE